MQALGSGGNPPKIASRCSVFAKTDLCHAQQAGYSLAEICNGLCLGLARNIADTIAGMDAVQRFCFWNSEMVFSSSASGRSVAKGSSANCSNR